MDMVQLNIRVPVKLKRDAIECAEANGYKDLSEFVRDALRRHITDQTVTVKKKEAK